MFVSDSKLAELPSKQNPQIRLPTATGRCAVTDSGSAAKPLEHHWSDQRTRYSTMPNFSELLKVARHATDVLRRVTM